jgi:hypothetical protein
LTILSALVDPIATLPKFTEAGDTDVGAMPVPLSARVFGLFEAFEATLSDSAGTAPRAVGVSVREMMQLAPAARVVPQVVEETAYSAGAVIEMLPTVVDCQFLRVTDLIGLVAPTTTFPKLSEGAESVTGAAPVPVKFTVSGPFGALVLIDREFGAAAPTAVGVKTTEILQFEYLASVLVQVELEME